MPNIHGLHSIRNDPTRRSDPDDHDDDDSDDGHANDRYVGGVDSRGGGSGLAVVPNDRGRGGGGGGGGRGSRRAAADSIFDLAEEASSGDASASGGGGGGGGRSRRTITMYRSGFTVDDGPHRRLDDPSNAEFLTSLARGRVPRELSSSSSSSSSSREGGGDDGEGSDVTVGLVDRRGEEYDPERHGGGGGGGDVGGFRSFSGEGQSLGRTDPPSSSESSSAAGGVGGGGVIRPSSDDVVLPIDESRPIASVAVRLLDGRRLVVRLNSDVSVAELGRRISADSNTDEPYVITVGYPPRALDDLNITVEGAGLVGSQVVLKRA